LRASIEYLKRFKRGKRGISTVIVVMLSLVLVVIVVGNVVLWSYQMNQVDTDKMQETLSLTNVANTRSPWVTAQNEFSISAGSILSGTYTGTKVLDGLHETFREEPQGFGEFNPSNALPVGSTSYVSGSLTDLSSNDGVYMNFRSYSSTFQTDAFVAYRDSTATLNATKERTWTGTNTTWNSQSELPDAGSPVRWVRVAYCPLESRSYEKIVVTLSDDGYLDAYIWDGTTWTMTNDIASSGISANAYKCFDVAYEKTSGRALLVYSRGTTTNEIGYKIWTYGSGWGSEQLLDLPYTSGIVRWVSLASCPGTRAGPSDDNEIALIYLDANVDVYGYTWNGSTWGNMGATAVWDATAAIATEECIAVAYAQTTGEAMFIWADSVSTDFYYKTWNGAALSSNTLLDIPTAGAVGNWVTLKADPVSDDLLFMVVDGGSDLNTAYWNGSEWTVHAEHDDTVDTNAQRPADFAWEPAGGKGLLVWGTTAGQITYKTFTAPNTWGPQQNPTMGANIHPWIQLRTNTRNIAGDTLILGAVLEGTVFDLGAIRWDGTTFTVIGTNTISADTTVITYECFELEFRNFNPPTQFTCEVELSGTGNAQNWTQLEWTADLAFTTPNVATTLQLYNYTASQYPTAGDGNMIDAIGQTDVTKNQTITTNSTNFRGSGNNWKIKITGTKTDTTPFDMKIDWIRLKVSPSDTCRLDINNNFTIDPVTYPRSTICGIEIQIRFNETANGERWFLKAYNWATGTFTDAGFNDTTGDTPTPNAWNDYSISVTANWADYVREDGVIRIELVNEGLSTNQATVEIDFLGARAIMNSTSFDVKNSSPLSIHIVALWITNSTNHQRYDADLFLNSGESASYLRADISLPENDFTAKVVTERGNIAAFSND
jgi:hypothetical protein